MAHSNQAQKRIRQNSKRQLQNKAVASRMRTQIKRLEALVASGDKAAAEAQLPLTMKFLDKAAKNHVIHPNAASRKKGRLVKAIARIGA